ncbi:glutamine-hydrolyzing carbamoyl-phosphate synthase small subunit [Anaerospora sp.]|jgi:carbamoyl-phosphate synthase small subunit|uniref:glutamine-hydrolyzing carbamoyl-phosphate synthase small subunit n=1 Tax=Anaerospora sp. TaxID=1960278 RepID=UPI00289BC275|nr:glutamine-hydrolyzing carbamoyl-phosphate synthase small subunit [Anaerospora sp.]
MKGKLVLEDGSCFYGQMIAGEFTTGEVVFNTGMTGYQEILTDPSYCGQIVTMTYPLIGNYGVNASFDQSRKPFVKGYIVSELCDKPSNWQSEDSLVNYLKKNKISCLYDVDTRAIAKRIRSAGTMRGWIVPEDIDELAMKQVMEVPLDNQQVKEVTTERVYKMPNTGYKVVVMDFGIKQNILDSLHKTGCECIVVPAQTDAAAILSYEPDGIFLSNGPGDPQDAQYAIETITKLITQKPIFGICLGHQLLALAMGAQTYKLKFGHRGSNHPVKDLESGRVYITSQNHGYAVDEASISNLDVTVTHRAVNDGTIEGFKHNSLPVFSVQYHPEAAPGPDDSAYLFTEFISLMAKED